jgi:hypothetical protein
MKKENLVPVLGTDLQARHADFWYRPHSRGFDFLVPILNPDMLIGAQHAFGFSAFCVDRTNFNDIDDKTRTNVGDIAFYRRINLRYRPEAKPFEARFLA